MLKHLTLWSILLDLWLKIKIIKTAASTVKRNSAVPHCRHVAPCCIMLHDVARLVSVSKMFDAFDIPEAAAEVVLLWHSWAENLSAECQAHGDWPRIGNRLGGRATK